MLVCVCVALYSYFLSRIQSPKSFGKLCRLVCAVYQSVCQSACLLVLFFSKFGQGNQQFEYVQFWHLSRSAVWQHPSAIALLLWLSTSDSQREHPEHTANYRALLLL